jgi:hypothetical protein
MSQPRITILELLAEGHNLRIACEREFVIHEQDKIARRAIGYFDAATVLLTAFPELHNELIDHPQFVAARKFKRQYQ